jgi:hypothetical protein
MCVKSYKWAIVNGILLWIIPFLFAFPIFTLQSSHPLLFQAIMMITALTTCIALVIWYLKKTGENTVKEGFILGCIWLAINLAFDLPIFLFIFNMPIGQYFTEIGLGYIMYPIITTGFTFVSKSKL